MAAALGVSAAYLSALEHGRRGVPSWAMVQKIIGYFNVIWDDAEELQRLAETSHPRVVIDTSGCRQPRPSSPICSPSGSANLTHRRWRNSRALVNGPPPPPRCDD